MGDGNVKLSSVFAREDEDSEVFTVDEWIQRRARLRRLENSESEETWRSREWNATGQIVSVVELDRWSRRRKSDSYE